MAQPSKVTKPSITTKIKLTILFNAIENDVLEDLIADLVAGEVSILTADDLFEKYETELQDHIEEFRQNGIETGLSRSEVFCRGYEDTQVAGQLYDGTWAGWTYYSGGGKHGYPSDVPWLEQAYPLDVVKEEVIKTVKREFKISEEVIPA